MIRNDFPVLNPDLAGLHQNQSAWYLGAIRTDFQEKFATDYFRRLEDNSNSVEKKFGKETQTEIMALNNSKSIEEVAVVWKKWDATPKAQNLYLLQNSLGKRKHEVNEEGLQIIASTSILNTTKNSTLLMVSNDFLFKG